MGRVFLGHDTLLDRPVAVKFIVSSEPDSAWRQRFIIEGRAVARLSHPNVVSVHRVGEVDGRPYLVSEFVQGQTLQSIDKPVVPQQILRIAVGLARGLAAAHEQGVLHRDVKPSNAILTENGEAKLLDFGVAKLLSEEEAPPKTDASPATALDGGTDHPWTVPLVSRASGLFGTPLYMAPEVRRGAPASRRSDVFSLGVVLYELWTGSLPWRDEGGVRQPVRPLAESAPKAQRELAAIIDRCLEMDTRFRWASGNELLEALEPLVAVRSPRLSPTGNPYRGLNAFEAEHRSQFFGREADVEALLGRLRSETLVVVVGDSGVGKSSLCRAGVLPALEEGALDDGRTWTCARLVPGRQPLRSLAETISSTLGHEARRLEEWFREESAALPRSVEPWLQQRSRSGFLLFIDQGEELFTLADRPEAERLSELISALVTFTAASRVLLCVRSDFVSRLATLRGFDGRVSQSLHLVGPLSRDRLRSAIVTPARNIGLRFESETVVDALVQEASTSAGGLPLLQFTLAELWEARDREQGLIPAATLEAMGGVGGALAKHADLVLRQLLPEERQAARRLLLSLVTAEGTRGRSRADELQATEGPARNALEALIRGRLLVAREHHGETEYELAHESLLTQWPALAEWLASDVEVEKARRRLEAAASEWQRIGRSPDVLLRGQRLRDFVRLGVPKEGSLEAEFVSASRRAHLRRGTVIASMLIAIPLVVGAVAFGASARSRREVRNAADASLQKAHVLLGSARQATKEANTRKTRAFQLFDGKDAADRETAESLWGQVLDLEERADAEYVEAAQLLESALFADPGRSEIRDKLEDATVGRMELAAGSYRNRFEAEMLTRLKLIDPTSPKLASRVAPAHVRVSVQPESVALQVDRYEDRQGLLVPVPVRRELAFRDETIVLAPGSYRLQVSAPGRAALTYPVLLKPSEELDMALSLPTASAIPEGYVLVPEGRFLVGSGDEEPLRRAQSAVPIHEVRTEGFLINRDETTFADWAQFLNALPTEARERRRPMIRSTKGGIRLEGSPVGGWSLMLQPTVTSYHARWGEPLRYLDRTQNVRQDWRQFPVSGISPADALAYVAWLNTSKTMVGARLCTDVEWERAARGADARVFTTGLRVPPSFANVDATYGQKDAAFGPDIVGLHPESDSPFGIHDLQGNALEIVASSGPALQFRGKGGSWYYDADYSGRLTTSESLSADTRATYLGLRICSNLSR